ncbi:hypothetical protein E1212_02835 [Jiangella ureilytica]|uniref:Uncharacterized protein n=1 Tax=Jiangella ureilytica TaxID=2530374 RepID=A0A4R4RZF4_9ACTN|nr:hypothetical protein E1212_02835 [Jiangella ureilytica]
MRSRETGRRAVAGAATGFGEASGTAEGAAAGGTAAGGTAAAAVAARPLSTTTCGTRSSTGSSGADQETSVSSRSSRPRSFTTAASWARPSVAVPSSVTFTAPP